MADQFPERPTRESEFYRMAKSRWEIENQGFNDSKNRYGMEHICHHEPTSILTVWLLIALPLVIKRLHRLRYLRPWGPWRSLRYRSVSYLWPTLGSGPSDTS
jgi:hypothetical protein